MKKRLINFFIIILILINFSACRDLRTGDKKSLGQEKNLTIHENAAKEKVEEDKKVYIELLAMGDMIFHRPLVNSSRVNDTYDFSKSFANISLDLQKADIALANFEGSINSDRKLSGFPLFNFPKETITGLKNAGFELLTTANNHCLDTGVDGVKETIKTINANGIMNVGTYLDSNHSDIIIEKNNIKVGFLAYTDLLNGMDGLIKDKEYMVNTFEDRDFKKDIDNLAKKVDFLVIIPHWGEEYQFKPSARQEELKNQLYEAGADIVLGSHPHVVQKCEDFYINGERKFICYSMGNAISNQTEKVIGKKGVESGLMIKLKLEKNLTKNISRIIDIETIPTCTLKYREGDKNIYGIFKYTDVLDGGKFSSMFDENSKRIFKERYEYTNIIIEGKNE